MNADELKTILDEHTEWLAGSGGSRAILRRADLTGAELNGADLTGADLTGAELTGANLVRANLSGANLSGANLSGANLVRANLSGANLSGANLSGATLTGANLSDVQADATTAGYWLVPPREGAFIGWKRCCSDVIVKLMIPAEARRSSATSRKCRAEFADVLEVIGAEVGVSINTSSIIYRSGERVTPDSWDDNRWAECSNGIHFFLSREEAEAYR